MPRENTLGRLIKQIDDGLEKRLNNELRGQDLTLVQMTVILILSEYPQMSAPLKDLERELRVAQSTTAGIVTRLEHKGFVEGYGDPADRRVKMVRLTDKGEQRCKDARAGMIRSDKLLMRGMTAEERQTLKRLLTIVRDNVK